MIRHGFALGRVVQDEYHVVACWNQLRGIVDSVVSHGVPRQIAIFGGSLGRAGWRGVSFGVHLMVTIAEGWSLVRKCGSILAPVLVLPVRDAISGGCTVWSKTRADVVSDFRMLRLELYRGDPGVFCEAGRHGYRHPLDDAVFWLGRNVSGRTVDDDIGLERPVFRPLHRFRMLFGIAGRRTGVNTFHNRIDFILFQRSIVQIRTVLGIRKPGGHLLAYHR